MNSQNFKTSKDQVIDFNELFNAIHDVINEFDQLKIDVKNILTKLKKLEDQKAKDDRFYQQMADELRSECRLE